MASQSSITTFFSEKSSTCSSSKNLDVDLPATRKRPAESGGSSKHWKTGVDPAWKGEFAWLDTTEDEAGEGMWCKVCLRMKCRPIRAPFGKAAWIEAPCRTITRQSLVLHQASECHREAIRKETSQALVDRHGGIAESFNRVISDQKKAFIGNLKCMYF